MIIKKIHIDRFGKFEDYTIELDDKCNIIYGCNEDGKSTIMTFIKMMFYGFSGKSSDISKNLRRKYQPWDGSKMSGSIDFEVNSVPYQLIRVFGNTNSTDQVTVMNLATGEREPLPAKKEPGQIYFGIGASAFEKSVFIGQGGSFEDSGVDKDDEITERLLNLVSTGDESVSQKKVDERLQKAKETLKSRSKRIGSIDKKQSKLDELKAELNYAIRSEYEKNEKEKELHILEELKNSFQKSVKSYRERHEVQNKLKDINNLRNGIQKKKKMDIDIAEVKMKKNKLKAGEKTVDALFISDGRLLASDIQSSKKLYQERERNLKNLQNEYDTLASKQIVSFQRESLDEVKALDGRIGIVSDSISKIKDKITSNHDYLNRLKSLNESKERLDANKTAYEAAKSEFESASAVLEEKKIAVTKGKTNFEVLAGKLEELRTNADKAKLEYELDKQNKSSVYQIAKQKVKIAKEQLEKASEPRQVILDEKQKAKLNIPLMAIAAIVLIVSAVLGFLVSPFIFAGILLSLVLAIIALGKPVAKSMATTVVDEAEILKAKTNLELIEKENSLILTEAVEKEKTAFRNAENAKRMHEELQKTYYKEHDDFEAIKEEFASADKKKSEIQARILQLNNSVETCKIEFDKKNLEIDEHYSTVQLSDVEGQEELLDTKQKELDRLMEDLKGKLDQADCATVDDFKEKFSEAENHKQKLAEKEADISRANTLLEEAGSIYEYKVNQFASLVSPDGKKVTYEEGLDILDGMERELVEISRLQVKIDSQSEIISEEFNGKTAEEIEFEIKAKEDELLKVTHGETPASVSEEEIERLNAEIEKATKDFQDANDAFIKMDTDVKNLYRNKKSVSQVEDEIRQVKKEIDELEEYYGYLDLAQSTLSEAFIEIRQSFGPMLNNKTAQIFNKLTDGKYQNVIISRNFDITVKDVHNSDLHDWKYLSSGTIDQAYLALRIAVSDLILNKDEGLPLMLDDVFVQYDDKRAKQGVDFIVDYANENEQSSQIILFTCHKRIVDWAQNDYDDIAIQSI
jgi:DNA repair protein SbcC/Rad50